MGDALFTLILPFGIMILVFYFLLIRPEKKRAKRAKEMLDNIQVADEIVTTGGIIGRVISVKEDTILLETGSDRTKIRILKNAVAENRTVHDS
ncbi:MAG: preprotein translocase subunit YajC [Oscillospiraceae bacterium]|nr:preprotein translocase subunit YajC [Oscillospiraceae bacterium]